MDDIVAEIPAPVRLRQSPPDRRVWWAMMALILAGISLTWWLSRIGNQLTSALPATSGATFGLFGCGPGQPCAHVLRSEYAVVLGKSLTKWNLAYYALLVAAMIAAVYAWQLPLSPPLYLMLPVVALIGVVGAAWCIFVMVWKLQAICYGCLSVHSVNVSIFCLALVYAVQGWRHKQYTRWEAAVPLLPITPVVLHMAMALMIGATQVVMMSQFPGQPAATVESIEVQPHALGLHPLVPETVEPLFLDGAGGGAAAADETLWTVKGRRDAPHRIVIFSCPTCPVCKQLNSVLKEVMSRHPGELRVDVRFYPLWHGCNSTIHTNAMGEKHRNACFLTRSALAVAMLKPEAFGDYLDWLYDNQEKVDEEMATRHMQAILGDVPWQATMDSPALWHRLREDVERSRQFEISVVPEMFLPNGKVYGGINLSNLEELLAREFSWQPAGAAADDTSPVWLSPDLIAAHGDRAVARVRLGQYADAVRELKESLRIKPDWYPAALQLASILAACPDDQVRNGAEAVYYSRLAQLSAKETTPLLLDVHGMALAENGEYQEAIQAARKAMELYNQAVPPDEKMADVVQQRMELYIKGKPYRMPK